MFCPHYTKKLAIKLGLRINKIKNIVLKKKIETVWANITISQFDKLFKDNLK